MTALDPVVTEHVLPAGTDRAYPVERGTSLRITNLHGQQVVDTWAVTRDGEYLSVAHTIMQLGRLGVRAGDALYSNRRRPLVTITADTSPGVHDLLVPACDPERYRLLGHPGHHRSCAENFREAVAEHGLGTPVPAPLNLFMNVPVGADGSLSFAPSPARPGDYVTLTAQDDLVFVLSACPQDMVPINGSRLAPADVSVRITADQPSGSA
ncbi:MAG TPA: urea carboxylase-associated family protein [Jatrophihabitans sp.]|nr:urea carboxylase-associated family protein [Jatrophihabitans sp.]